MFTIDGRGLVTHGGNVVCRVTRLAGVWGHWHQGVRIESPEWTRDDAAVDAVERYGKDN